MALKKLLLFFIFLTLLFCAATIYFAHALFFSQKEYIVFVEDSFYAQYSSLLYEHQPEGFIILKNSDFPSEKKERTVAAYLSLEKDIPILDGVFSLAPHKEAVSEHQPETRYYIIEEKDILPSIKADFSSKKRLDTEPTLSLRFLPERVGQGERALPVENEYAGSKDYALRAKLYARCTIFDTPVKDNVLDFFNALFSKAELSTESAFSPTVFLASVGDIMVARGAEDVLIRQKGGLEKVFGTTLPLLQKSDFTLGNLEGVVTASEKNAIKTYTFKFKKEVLPKLQEAGFDYLMQTNNHCYDYGEEGFKDTLTAFAAYKIPSSGIGYTKAEARQFYHTNVQGLDIAIISCGAFPVERSGFNGFKSATATENRAGILWQSPELLSDIAAEKEKGNFVIVNVHGGEEYVPYPTKSQRALYESFCDSGADIVFGSHPHVLQDTEWYKKSLIVYSMGNFIFNGMEEMPGATESEVVRVGIYNGAIAYLEQYPAKLDNFTVSLKD